MHLLEHALFRNQIVACGKGDICYVRNDGMGPAKVELVFHVWQDLGAHSSSHDMEFSFFIRPGRIQWFQLPSNFVGNAQVVLIDMKVNNKSLSNSLFLRDMPKNIDGLKKTEILIETSSIRQNSDGAAVVELESSNLALLVVLTASTQGRFSENCMTLLPMEKKVRLFAKSMEKDLLSNYSRNEGFNSTHKHDHVGVLPFFLLLRFISFPDCSI